MSRHTPVLPDALTDTQARFWREVTQGARKSVKAPEEFLDERGSLRGPFGPWLHQPEAGLAVVEVSNAIRFNGGLPARLREVAILATAVHWRADYVRSSHVRFALREGVSSEDVAAIEAGRAPEPEDEAAVFAVVWPLLTEGRVPGPAFEKARALLGEAQLVELVMLVGQYSLFAMTVNAFEIVPTPAADQKT